MTRRLLPVVCIIGLILCAGSAFPWSGSLSTETGGLQYSGSWRPATLSWDVTQVGNAYHYAYTLDCTQYTGKGGGVSHAVIELTDDEFYGDFEYPSNDMFDLVVETWNGSAWETVVSPGLVVGDLPVASGNPNMPEDIFGGKFTPGGGMKAMRWSFSAYRAPVWGDFYGKDGGGTGADALAVWNTGFAAADPVAPPQDGSINNHILRPNGPVPVTPELPPSALMGLGMLPLGLAYLRGRRRQES